MSCSRAYHDLRCFRPWTYLYPYNLLALSTCHDTRDVDGWDQVRGEGGCVCVNLAAAQRIQHVSGEDKVKWPHRPCEAVSCRRKGSRSFFVAPSNPSMLPLRLNYGNSFCTASSESDLFSRGSKVNFMLNAATLL